MIDIHLGDNLPILQSMPPASFDLIYVDPPFNTGKVQSRKTIRTVHDEQGGDRKGFMGKRYRTTELGTKEYNDAFDETMLAFANNVNRLSGWSTDEGLVPFSPRTPVRIAGML